MKKLLFLTILMVMTSLLLSIIYVPGNYSTIQAAVAAAPADETIIVDNGTYNGCVTINTWGLTIQSVNGAGLTTISANGQYCLDVNSGGLVLDGFTLKNASESAIDVFNDIDTVKNCIFEDNGGISAGYGSAIKSWAPFNELSGCIFRDNEGPYTVWISKDYPLGSNPNVNELVKNNLFYDNTNTINNKDIYLLNASNDYHGVVENCTFAGPSGGIHAAGVQDLEIRNCIFSSAGISHIYFPSSISISYSAFTGAGYQNTYNWGLGNLVSTDPKFCPEEPYKHYLLEGSPCIDAGNPATTGGDVRIDMGCYESTTDVKLCEGDNWNWVSFPRLNRTGNGNYDVTTVLDEFLDWPFVDLSLLHYSTEQNPTLYYDHPYWYPTSYDVKSSLGYKLNTEENGDHYLPLDGSRLLDIYQLTYNLVAGVKTENWMGYWLPESQNIVDAFGSFWTYVEEIWSEDWYYNKNSNNRGISEPVSWSTSGKTLEYGKGYIVRFERTTQISGFYWSSSGTAEEPKTKGESENFLFNDKPDYEVIDVVDILEEVIEIGVYQDDVCVGAVVVEDECEQILVYSDGLSREPIPYNFEIITNSRSLSLPVVSYKVLNIDTGEFESGSVISGQQNSSVIMFGSIGEGQQETPIPNMMQLMRNYPNPFNPITNISFSLPAEQVVELTVYNTKGQTVRKLVQGQFTTGEHTVTWDGKDDNGKNVGSGLYFYKLITNDQEISKKMLLLK
jgi:FlgD Ig-like domain